MIKERLYFNNDISYITNLMNWIIGGKLKLPTEYEEVVEHCPACKQVVGTRNDDCKYKDTRLHQL